MTRLFRAIAPAAGLLLLMARPVAAAGGAVPESDYARINAALLEHHVMPRYERLHDAARDLAAAAAGFCDGAGESGRTGLLQRYHDAMDAWMGIQHIRFGPVELFLRSYRFYFWPEARGKVAGAVVDLLAVADTAALAPEALADASVAVQGLPAVEHLLFIEQVDPGTRACRLLAGVAANMHRMARGIIDDWRGGDVDFGAIFRNPSPENAYYDSHRAATLDLFKSFHGGLRLIADIKLKPVVGDTIDGARPRLAESRASARALRNIVVNLEALCALYLGDGGAGLSELVTKHGGDEELDPLMRKAFRLTIESARSIEGPLAGAVTDAAQRPRVEQLNTRVLALKQIVRSRVADALGLAVGFNALDGD